MTGVAVITGGASGFGLALGRRCGALGMDVVLLDLDADRAAAEAAQPDHFRRPVAGDGDLDAAVASNPSMATALATPEDAAAGVVEAVLAGRPYVVTHGDLTPAVAARSALHTIAADAARPAKDD